MENMYTNKTKAEIGNYKAGNLSCFDWVLCEQMSIHLTNWNCNNSTVLLINFCRGIFAGVTKTTTITVIRTATTTKIRETQEK